MPKISTVSKTKVIAIDLELQMADSKGTTYYRLDNNFKDFLHLCHEKHGIIGFEFEDGSFNFGVILGKEKSDA